MGVVFEAIHEPMRRRVALKVLSDDYANREEYRQRFLHEARAAGKLHHTNIVPVFDVGEFGDKCYFAMQLIQGQNIDLVVKELQSLRGNASKFVPSDTKVPSTLSAPNDDSDLTNAIIQNPTVVEAAKDVAVPPKDSMGLPSRLVYDQTELGHSSVARSSLFTNVRGSFAGQDEASYFRRVAAVGIQIAEALNYAHASGVLHRDVKPSNIILDIEGTAWILDFGLAKTSDENLTNSGNIMGTLRYMAPERLEGLADERADIYGLGITLYEMCTLCQAFEESEPGRLLKQVAEETPVAPRRVRPGIPVDLETIILKAIEREPSRRYRSASDLAQDLQLYLLDHPILARRSSILERSWRFCRRNSLVTALSLVILSLALVTATVSTWFWWQSERQRKKLVVSERRSTSAFELAMKRNYELNLQRAVSSRWTQRPGRQFQALNAIREAAALLPLVEQDPVTFKSEQEELRDQAVASLALVDLQVEKAEKGDFDWFNRLDFRQDYSEFVLSRDAKTIAVCDASNGETVSQIVTGEGQIYRLRFSHDGKAIYAEHKGESRKWVTVRSRKDLAKVGLRLETQSGDSQGVFSPFDQTLAIRRSGRVEVYSLENGALEKSFETGQYVERPSFASDRCWLGLVEHRGKSIEIWDYQNEPVLLHRLQLEDAVRTFAMAPDHELYVAGLYNGEVLVWTQGLEQEPTRHALHSGAVTNISIFSDGSRFCSDSWDGTTRVFNVSTQSQELRMDATYLAGPIGDNDRKLGFFQRNGEYGFWEVASPITTTIRPNPEGIDGTSTDREVHFYPPEDRILLIATPERLEFWDRELNQLLSSEASYKSPYCKFSSDGKYLFISGQRGFFRIPVNYDASTAQVSLGSPTQVIDRACKRFEILPDETGALVITNGSLYRVVFSDSSQKQELGRHPGLASVVVSPDGRWAASGSWQGSGLQIWDLTSNALHSILLPESANTSAAFSRDSKRLVGADSNSLYAWDTDSFTPVAHNLRRDKNSLSGRIFFSHVGNMIVADDSRYVPQLIGFPSLERLTRLELPESDNIRFYSFSQDGSHLAIAQVSKVTLWDLERMHQALKELDLRWPNSNDSAAASPR